MSIIYVNCGWRNKNRSNPCSYEYYSASSEIKAWKQFRSLWNLNPWPLKYWCYCILFFLIFFICTFLWQIIEKPQSKSLLLHLNGSPVQRQVSPAFCQFSLTGFGHLKKTVALEEVLGVREVPCPKTQQNYPDFSLNHTLR